MLSVRGLCNRLFTCTEESYGCLSVVSVVCFQRFLRPADHLYRGVLWISVCLIVVLVRYISVRRGDHIYRGVLIMSLCGECCVMSGRGLCDGLIPCTEDLYGCLLL